MTTRDILLDRAEAALAATMQVVGELVPGAVEHHGMQPTDDPLGGVEPPAVLARVAFDQGQEGRLALALTVSGTRRLAAALGAIDEEEAEFGGGDLGDRELRAVGQALEKVAAALSAGSDRDLAPGRADVRVVASAAELAAALELDGSTAAAALTLLGEPARLAVLVPDAVLDRLEPAQNAVELPGTPLGPALRSVSVRVWAELGRTRMPTGEVVALPSGAIVELDRDAEDAVDLYVDGQRYATGRLVVTDDDSWGVVVEHVLGIRA